MELEEDPQVGRVGGQIVVGHGNGHGLRAQQGGFSLAATARQGSEENILQHNWFFCPKCPSCPPHLQVHTAAKLVQMMAYQNKNALQAGMIVAGWDRHEGGVVYGIPLGGTLVKVPFTIGGSGSAYIYGLCDKLWRVSGWPS